MRPEFPGIAAPRFSLRFPLSLAAILISSLALACLPALAAPETSKKPSNPQGWLGVALGADPAPHAQDASAAAADAPPSGVAIAGVVADGPARRAGVRARDQILAVDGNPVSSAAQLMTLVRSLPPDGWVSLSILRGERTLELRAFLEARPENAGSLRMLEGWIGVEAIDLPPDLREHFGAPRDAGVMISHVETGSPAVSAGLSPGDVVFEVDGDPVRSARGFANAVAGGGVENRIEIRLMRDGARITVEPLLVVRPENSPEGDRR